MLYKAALLLLLQYALASPIELLNEVVEVEAPLQKRACPNIHLFGARETTVAQGYGTSAVVVDLVLAAHSGSTSEAIVYPACGGQASCGDISYASSVLQGVAAVASQVNTFNTECPDTLLVLVGYSQGGQIFDDAFCGGGDSNEGLSNTAVEIQSSAVSKIVAAIFMGDPRYIYGLSYEVGTCTAEGFAPRPAGFSCPSAAKIQSYCDASDPYCCNGDDAATHEGYGTEYGQVALTFINAKLAAAGTGTSTGGTTTTTTAGSTTTTTSTGSGTVAKWGQCGGIGYTGATTCASGSTCTYSNAYYSQCL